MIFQDGINQIKNLKARYYNTITKLIKEIYLKDVFDDKFISLTIVKQNIKIIAHFTIT